MRLLGNSTTHLCYFTAYTSCTNVNVNIMNMICIILSWYVSIVAPDSSASRIHTTEMDLRNESPQMSLSEPKPEADFIVFTEINHSEDFCLEDKLSEDEQAAS